MSIGGNRLNVGVLGASGYTGAELLRLLVTHDGVNIAALTADRRAGQPIEAVFPHLGGLGLPTLVANDEVDWSAMDVAFCCLPHGTTQEIIAALPEHLKIVDLSADFRLRDIATYAEWYGHEHRAPALQSDAVYGLTEAYRDEIARARLVAAPGCYPTGALLPLIPLLEAGQIVIDEITIDAKSGTTGAGRAAKEGMLFSEVGEGFSAYGIAGHRHMPEMEQELSVAAGQPVTIGFTPHLVPMSRGILSTIYVRLRDGASADDLRATLDARYADEPFVRVLPAGFAPATQHVRGSNHCLIGVHADRRPGRAVLVSAIDNLTKGSSGQAVQDMNIMYGLDERRGLGQAPLFP
ncbi:N-acetyl-gamma-glutamyl-phosphate reductase [Oceanibacterium hippocampi]|uniref:N-acetyl-gamma-glutamyl-phosphate reductase n=1 Tax=Oceanibacterium hippocampi TaxID=745714 RepID=A0A1Y5SUE8_9PROT|nr:N-acetyl-gamma-glutamyl-phosphate reductase [Oceanibacterium hippocampi]SLN45390.1 N-acetyl-gamma-glutamyl-phosphate reductase [Oceanibacterium hippocampi]